MEQLKRFFSHEFSMPFIIICCGVIVAGAVHAGYVVSDLKQDVDTKITQRENELDKIYDTEDRKNDIEYKARNEKYKECISEYKRERPWLDNFSYISPSLSGCGREPYNHQILRFPHQYLKDASYKELSRIKNTSSFQLFFEKFGFGWWGVIALVTVFLINILIVFYKLIKMYAPFVFWHGNTRTKSIKINMQDMTPFQRYSLILLAITALALVIIAIVLIF